MSDRTLPSDERAERTILGAILLENQNLADASLRLLPDDFSLDSHRRIFTCMTELISRRRAVDIVTLAHELTRQKEIESIGGVTYLASLTEGLPRRLMIADYVEIVKDKSVLRRVITTCSDAIARAYDQGENGLDLIGRLTDNLQAEEFASLGGADLESVGQWLEHNDIFAERSPGVLTGIDTYDDLTKGLHAKELTVIAARTSMGKTSMAGSMTWKIAQRGKSVAVFLNEQKKASFLGRMLCGRATVSFKNYRFGTLDWVEKQYIEEARDEFRTLPIYWDTGRPMSLSGIKSKARRLKRTGELDVVMVDQLNGIGNQGLQVKGLARDEILGMKVSSLKDLADELEVPVVLYHQLNRGTLKNDGARPSLADLKGSGEIEEHADNVAFLHRPGYYTRSKDDEGKDLIILAKQRDGETGDAEAEFVPSICRWQDRSQKQL